MGVEFSCTSIDYKQSLFLFIGLGYMAPHAVDGQ